jgi:DNA-binding transcriptional ArsR family regulator
MRNRSVTYSAEATFHALADPTRRAVLDLLRHGAQPAGQIAGAFPVSRPAISRHLRQLRLRAWWLSIAADAIAITSSPPRR